MNKRYISAIKTSQFPLLKTELNHPRFTNAPLSHFMEKKRDIPLTPATAGFPNLGATNKIPKRSYAVH